MKKNKTYKEICLTECDNGIIGHFLLWIYKKLNYPHFLCTLKLRYLILEYFARKYALSSTGKHCEMRANYIKELYKNYKKGLFPKGHYTYNNAFAKKYFSSKNRDSIFLVMDVFFDHKKNVEYGNYLLEVFDPIHRLDLQNFYKKWDANAKNINFYLWLEKNYQSSHIPEIEYLSESEKRQCELINHSGKLYEKRTGKPLTTESGKEYIFILDDQNRLYGIYSSEPIRHTSLSLGKPVICVGDISARKGQLLKISLDSGHYHPKLQTLVAFNNFIQIPKKTVIEFYDGNMKTSSTWNVISHQIDIV